MFLISEKELPEMSKSSTNIYKKHELLTSVQIDEELEVFDPSIIHLAQFTASYYKKFVNTDNDFQSTSLPKHVDSDDNGSMQLPKLGQLNATQIRKVFTFFVDFALSFTNENDLMLDKSYSTKLSGENVLEVVTQNKQKIESNGDLINSYFQQFHQQEVTYVSR